MRRRRDEGYRWKEERDKIERRGEGRGEGIGRSGERKEKGHAQGYTDV